MKLLSAITLVTLFAFTCGAVSLLTITKTPYEAFTCGVDFAQVIGSDGMTLLAVVATDPVTGTDVTSTYIAASPAPAIVPATSKVAFRVQGGANNKRAVIGVRVQDSTTGDIFEGQITLQISSGTGH